MSETKLAVVENGVSAGEFPRERERVRSALIKASVNYENLGNQLIEKADELVRLRKVALERAKEAIREEEELLAENFR